MNRPASEDSLNALKLVVDNHEKRDDARFDKMFDYLKDNFKEIKDNLKDTNTKVGELWDDKNRKEGAINFGRFISASLGGLLVAVLDYISYRNK